MKRKKLFLMLMLACLLCFTACSKEEEPQPASDAPEEEVQNPVEDEQDGEDAEEPEEDDLEEEPGTEAPTLTKDPVNITIYYCNDDATDFASEEVQIASLSETEVLKALVDKGVLSEDVRVLSFESTVVDGKNSIDLDLNGAFTSYISSIGSTGEYYTVGGICNTFLAAYDCEQIKITVEGQDLASGHTEYPGYMTAFSGGW